MERHRTRFFFILSILVVPLLAMAGGFSRPGGAQENLGTFHVLLVLAIDQSGSMSTNDAEGWRFDAAKFLVGALDEGDEVAVFTFAAETKAIVASSPPKVIGGSEDKLALWRTIDALRFDRSQSTTDMLGLFQSLDKYFNGLSPRARTQTLLVFLTDGQDYPNDTCRTGAPPSDAAQCSQHRQQAQDKGTGLREAAVKRFEDPQLGNSFTLLPIALKGPTADYDLDFLAAVSGLTKNEIPQASATDLIETFKNQIVGRMLDRVAISGVETERRGIFSFNLPDGARSLTFATTGTKTQSGQTLPVWHPTLDNGVSAPASCNEVEGGCLAVIPNPEAGSWWVEQQGGGIPPQAFLRFDLDLVVTPAILPAGHPVSATVDLRNRISGRSLLDTGYWSVAPRTISAAGLAAFTVQQKPEGVRIPGQFTVKKGDVEVDWNADALAWPALIDRSSLAPLDDQYRLVPGETVPLVVAVQMPPDPAFQMGEVVARLAVGNQAKDITMHPDSQGRYAAAVDALSMLGQADQGTLTISYEVRDASYQGFTYPADWWRVEEVKTPTIVRVRNRVTVTPATVDLGWLRRRDAKTQAPVTLSCDQCEQGTTIPLKLEVAKWQTPGNANLSLDPLVLQLLSPLESGEQRQVTLDLGETISRLPQAQASGYGSFSVTGGTIPVDIKPSQLVIRIDNRSELQRLWQDANVSFLALGLLSAGWTFFTWEAQYPWVITPAILCVALLGLTLSLFMRHRRWLTWAPLALIGGGFGVLFALTAVRLVRGAPHFSYDLEWSTGENPPDLIRMAGVAPLEFTISNDAAARSYHTVSAVTSLVYARLAQAGATVSLAGLRGTQVCEEGGVPTAETVRMLPGRRYFLVSPGADFAPRGSDDLTGDWSLTSPATRGLESSRGTSRRSMTRGENEDETGWSAVWLRLSSAESTASEGSTETDTFNDFGNF